MSTSYHGGEKHVDGKTYYAKRLEHFKSSNGVTVYTTTLWEDNEASCNCPSWAMRKVCKHTKIVLTGGRGNAEVAAVGSGAVVPSRFVKTQSVGAKPVRKINLLDE